jgi:hypothetical protein
MLIIFFQTKGIVHEEFVLVGQKFNFEYYCDGLRRLSETVRRLRPVSNFLFHHRIFFTENNLTAVTHPPYSLSVSPIEDKTERPPFLQN